MLFKKVDANVLDVVLIYACGAFLTYIVGTVAYQVGKEDGKTEANKKKAKVRYHDAYGKHKD